MLTSTDLQLAAMPLEASRALGLVDPTPCSPSLDLHCKEEVQRFTGSIRTDSHIDYRHPATFMLEL